MPPDNVDESKEEFGCCCWPIATLPLTKEPDRELDCCGALRIPLLPLVVSENGYGCWPPIVALEQGAADAFGLGGSTIRVEVGTLRDVLREINADKEL